jgi:hypothetical protein
MRDFFRQAVELSTHIYFPLEIINQLPGTGP